MRALLRHFRAPSVGAWIRRLTIITFIALFAAATPNLIQPEPQAVAVPGGEPVDFSSNVSNPWSNYAYASDHVGFRVSQTATWEGWINPSTCSGSCTWMGKAGGYLFRVNNNGTHGWAMMGPSGQWWWNDTNINARFGEWQHVAWTKEGSTLRLFIDGNQVFERFDTFHIPAAISAGQDFAVHNRRDSLSEAFSGRIDELRVWNVARTEAQIRAQMHTRPSGTGLQLYYDFNDADSGSLENLAPGATSATTLRVLGSLGATDVKTIIAPSAINAQTTYVFPRSYITREGGWRVPSGVHSVDAFVVGGGGGGGGGGSTGFAGGGGGGAQVLRQENFAVVPGQGLTVEVGMGGRGAQSVGDTITRIATSGQASALGNLSSTFGGAGGSGGGFAGAQSALLPSAGASGGGGALYTTQGAAGISGLGHAGGGAPPGGTNGNWFSAGGGGGVLGPGLAATSGVGVGGRGGPGVLDSITGQLRFYAAGGSAKGCKGGGSTAEGATAPATNALANSGSGGGGGGGGGGTSCFSPWPTTQNGGNGGSGLVAVSFFAQTGPNIPALNAGNCTPISYFKVIGGVNFQIHEFVGGSDCQLNIPEGVTNLEVFGVGGGGGGGNNVGGGGGGGGSSLVSTTRTAVGGALRVTVGAGGAGGLNFNDARRLGQNGQASVVRNSANSVLVMQANPGQGGRPYHQGFACGGSIVDRRGGAGGAASTGGSAGGLGGMSANPGHAQNGADGFSTTFTGDTRFFGGAGGGGTWNGTGLLNGLGGKGGGGAGAFTSTRTFGMPGLPNTGGGGGGGEVNCGNGGDGGSGIVIVRYPVPSTATGLAIARPASQVIGTGASNPFGIQPLIHVVNGSGQLVSSTVNVTARVLNGSTMMSSATVQASGGVADFSGSGLFTSVATPASIVFEATGLLPVSQGVQPMTRPLSITIVPDANRLTSTPGAWVGGEFFAQPSARAAELRISDVLQRLNQGLVVNLVAAGGNITVNENIVSSANAGSLQLMATGTIVLNRNIDLNGPTSSFEARATDDVLVAAGASNNYRTLHTNNGSLVLWANSNNNNQGVVQVPNFVDLRSGGGDIYLAGGAAQTVEGRQVPGGVAFGYSGTYPTGVELGTSAVRDQVRIFSSGGDVVIRGATNQGSGNGFRSWSGLNLQSGAGQIEIVGNAFGASSPRGLVVNEGGGTVMGSYIISQAEQSPAIRLSVNNDSAGSNWGLVLDNGGSFDPALTTAAYDRNGGTSWIPQSNAIATNRLINVWGKAGIDIDVTQRTYLYGALLRANLLSETGEIGIHTGNKVAYLNGASSRATYIGAMPNSPVPVSNADIRVTTSYTIGEDHVNIATNGAFSLEPSLNNNFDSDIYFPRSTTVIGDTQNTPSSFRIGNFVPGSGDGLGYSGTRYIELNRAFTVSGPIEINSGTYRHYQQINAAGPVTIRSEFTANLDGSIRISGQNQDLRVISEDIIYTTANQRFQTNRGNILLGSNADNNGTGFIQIRSGNVFNTANGTTTANFNTSTSGNIVFAGAQTMSGSFPVGYADSFTNGAHGVGFDSNNATTQLISGGGDILIRGRGSDGNGNSFGVFLAGGLINAGDGTVKLDGIGRVGNNYGVELAGSVGARLRIFAAGGSNATSSPAIEIKGRVEHASWRRAVYSGYWASTVNDNLVEARGEGGISILGERTAGADYAVSLTGTSLFSRIGTIHVATNAGTNGVFFAEGYYAAPVYMGAATSSNVTRVSQTTTNLTLDATILTSSAPIDIRADMVYSGSQNYWVNHTAGDVSIVPAASQFRSMPFIYSKMYGIGALTVGTDNNPSQQVRLHGEVYGAGPHRIYGGIVEVYGPIRATAPEAEILLKSSREIYVYDLSPGGGLFTNNGDITLWSGTANVSTDNSFIRVNDGVNIISALPASSAISASNVVYQLPSNFRSATEGGDIVFGSGPATDGLGPTGFAQTRNGSFAGIEFGHSSTQNTMYSGGGDIRLRARSGVSGPIGVILRANKTIASGLGQIEIRADHPAGVNSRGIELGHASGGLVRIYSSATLSPAISIEANNPSTTGDASLLIGHHANDTSSRIDIQAMGPGGISIKGNNAPNSSFFAVEMNGTQALSATGDVVVDGGVRGVRFNSWIAAWGHNTFGSCTASGIPNGMHCATSQVITSSADVRIVGDRVAFSTNNNYVGFRTNGNVVVEPTGQVFAAGLDFYGNFSNQTPQSIRFGKDVANHVFDTNTYQALTASSTIELYGRDLNTFGNLSVLNPGSTTNASGIRMKATRHIFTGAQRFDSNGGSIVMWSATAGGEGAIRLWDGSTICSSATFATAVSGSAPLQSCRTTGGGEVILGGGSSTTSQTVTTGPNTTIPAGFARGYGNGNFSGHQGSASSGDGYLSGVSLGFLHSNTAPTSIFSGGADITIRGESTRNSSIWNSSHAMAFGIMAMGGNSTTSFIDASGGKVLLHGQCNNPQNFVVCGGVMLNAYATDDATIQTLSTERNLRFVVASTNPAADSIRIIGNTAANNHHGFFAPHGVTFRNSNQGGLVIQSDRIFNSNWSSNFEPKIRFEVSGDVVLEPVGASFLGTETFGRHNYTNTFASTPKSFRYGKPGNNGQIRFVNGSLTAQERVEFHASSFVMDPGSDANAITVNNPGGLLLVRANANIELPLGRSLRANSSPIVLWANATGTNAGYISSSANISSTFSPSVASSDGAPIYLGGGSVAQATSFGNLSFDVPAGAAFGSGNNPGVSLASSTLTSGQGLIRINGHSRATTNINGVSLAGARLIAGSGPVTVIGTGAALASGRAVSLVGGSEVRAQSGDISITGNHNASNTFGSVEIVGSRVVNGSGSISITGNRALDDSDAATGVLLSAATIDSVTGAISISAPNSKFETLGNSFIGTANSAATSSADVTIQAKRLDTAATRLAASGNLVIEPSGASFEAASGWELFEFAGTVSNFSSLRIGKSGTVTTQSLNQANLNGAISVNGPIEIHASTLNLRSPLRSTAQASTVSLQLTTLFSSSAAVSAQDGTVRVRANALSLAVSATLASGQGAVEVASATSGTPIRILSPSAKATAPAVALNISTGDLEKMTGTFLRIGAVNAGAVTIEAPIVRTQAGSNTLRIMTAGSVTNAVADIVSHLSVSNVAVQAGGSIRLSSNYNSGTPTKLALNSSNTSSGNVQYLQIAGTYTPHLVDGVTPVYGVATSARASQVPTTEPTTVYQNATVSPQPRLNLTDAYAQTLNARNTLAGDYVFEVSTSELAQLTGTTTSNAVNGVAVFNGLRFLGSPGNFPLTFRVLSGTDVVSTVTTGDYQLLSSQPSSLRVQWTNPKGVAGGSLLDNPTVTLIDDGGNAIAVEPFASATISATITGPQGQILSGAEKAASSGVATFDQLVIAGRTSTSYTIEFSVVVSSQGQSRTISAAVNNFTLEAGAPASLRILTQPTDIAAGRSFSPELQLEILDSYNNRVVSNSALVVKPVFVGAAQYTSESANVTANNGVIAFANLGFTRAGSYQIRFENVSSSPLASVTTAQFTVGAGAPHALEWDTQPSNVVSRAIMTAPRLKVFDAYGNHVVTDNSTTAQLRVLNSASAITTPNSALGLTKQASAGFITFDGLRLGMLSDTYSLEVATATNAGAGLGGNLGGASSQFMITPGAPHSLQLVTEADGVRAGLSFTQQPVVRIRDVDLNTVLTNANIVMTVNQIRTTGSATVTANNGIAAFVNAGVAGPRGNYQVTYTLNSGGNLISTTQQVVLEFGSPAKIEVLDQPVNKQTGERFPVNAPRIRLLDSFDNPVTGVNNLSAIATLVSSLGATLNILTQSPAVNFDSNGVASFQDFDFVAAPGSYRLSFAAGDFAPINSSVFTVTVADPAILTWQTPPPSTLVTGINMPQAILELTDRFGNLISSDTTTVVNLTTANSPTLSGASVVAQGGRFIFTNFNMIAVPGDYTLTATTNVGAISVSRPITIVNDVAAKLEVKIENLQTPKAGQPLQYSAGGFMRVRILDRFDNLVTVGADSSLRVTVSATAVAVTGQVGATATGGIANFAGNSISISGVANTTTGYNLLFTSNTTRGSLVIGRESVMLAAGTPVQVQISTQPPTSIQRTKPFAPGAIEVFDSWSNPVTDNSTVVLQLWSNSAAVSESSVAVTANAHTFSSLTHTVAPGNGYRLRMFVSGHEDNAVLSRNFRIFSGDPSSIQFAKQPDSEVGAGGALGAFGVSVRDAGGYLVDTAITVPLKASLLSGNTVVTNGVSPDTSATILGLGTFSDVVVSASPGTYKLRIEATGSTYSSLTSVESSNFTITNAAPASLSISFQVASVQASRSATGTVAVVRILDRFGNLVVSGPGKDANIVMEIDPTGTFGQLAQLYVSGVLATSRSVPAQDGIATFTNIAIGGNLGTYTARYTAPSLASMTVTRSVQVQAGPATNLRLIQQPQGPFVSGELIGRTQTTSDVAGSATVTTSCPVLPAGAGTVQLVNGRCIIEITRVGQTDFVFPTDAKNLKMLAVGGGASGACDGRGGGSGGEVRFLDASSTTGGKQISVTVGAGGAVADYDGGSCNGHDGQPSFVQVSGAEQLRAGQGLRPIQSPTDFWYDSQGVHPVVGSGAGTIVLSNARGGNGARSVPSEGTAGANGASAQAVLDRVGISRALGGGGGGGTSNPLNGGNLGGVGGGGKGSERLANGCYTHGYPGLANTGGGGGGGQANNATSCANQQNGVTQRTDGGAGGSGIVIITFEPTPKVVPVVAVVDSFGNQRTGESGSITAAVQAGNGTFVATSATQETLQSGVAVFDQLFLNGVVQNDHRLRFSSSIPGVQSVDSALFTMVHGVAAQFTITRTPSSQAVAGSALAIQPAALLRDAAGNQTTRDSSTVVSLRIVSTANLSFTYSAVTSAQGHVTFSNLVVSGRTTNPDGSAVTFTIILETETFQSAASAPITLLHAAPAQLTIESQPTVVAAGVPSADFVVAMRDQFGNLITDWNRSPWSSDQSPRIDTVATSGVQPTYSAIAKTGPNAGRATISGVVIHGTANAAAPISFSYVANGYDLSVSSTVRLIGGAPTRLAMVSQPSIQIVAGETFAIAPVVKLQDDWFNDTTASATVSATVIRTVGAVTTRSETLTVSAVAGIADFSNISTSASASPGYQLRFTIESATETLPASPFLSTLFTVLPADPFSFKFVEDGNFATSQESGLTLKSVTGSAIVLEVLDVFGNRVAIDTTTVFAANVTSGSNTVTSLNGRTARAANGLVSFNALTLNAVAKAGYVISFTATNAGTPINGKVVAGSSFNLLAGTAAQLSLVTQSGVVRSGKVFSIYPALEIRDAEGSLITTGPNSTLSATISISHVVGGSGALPIFSAPAVVEAAGGVANFTASNLVVTGPVGFYVLTYTIENTLGTKISTTETIELFAGDPVDVRFVSSAPSQVAAGKTFTPVPVAELIDSNGNRVRMDNTSKVVLELLNSSNTVVETTPAVISVNGVVSFPGVSFSAIVGQHSMRVKLVEIDGDPNAANVGAIDTSATFDIVHGDPTKFSLIGDPSTNSYVVGSVYPNFAVRLFDAFGNEAISDNSAVFGVSVSPLSGHAFQRQSSGSAVAENGIATFSNYVMIARPGNYEVEVSGSWMGQALQALTSTFSVTVVHAAPAQIAVARAAEGARSRLNFSVSPSIEVRDAFGNLTTNAVGTVTIEISNPASASFALTPTAPMNGGFATFSAMALAGSASDYVLTYKMNIPGGQLTATQPITLEAGNPFSLRMKSDLATTTRAGSLLPIQPVVQVMDLDLNLVEWDSETVVEILVGQNDTDSKGGLLKADGLTTITDSAELRVTAASGEANFSTLRFKGGLNFSYSFVVSASGLVSAASTEFRVTPGPVGIFTFVSQDVSNTNGETLAPTVIRLRDSFGNEISDDDNTVVTAAIFSGTSGALSGTTSARAQQGLVTFDGMKLSGLVSQTYVLNYSSGATFLQGAGIALTPAAPSQLNLVSLNTEGAAGVGFTPVELRVSDFSGNLITNANGVISAVAPAGVTATPANTAITTGVASPTVVVTGRTGEYTITYRATYGTTVLSATHTMTLSHGVGNRIGIVTQPAATGTQTGAAFTPQPVVELRDAYGNRVPLAGVTITATLQGLSTSGAIQKATLAAATGGNWSVGQQDAESVLPTPTAVTAADGTATFEDLAVVGVPGHPYQLVFSATGYLPSNASSNFTLLTANPFDLHLAQQATGNFTAGSQAMQDYVVQLRDRFRNIITSNNSARVQMRIKVDANDPAVGRGGVLIDPASESNTVTLSNGIAVFSGFKLGGIVGTPYRFQFVASSLGVISDDTQAVGVQHGAPVALVFSQSPTLVNVDQNFPSDQRPVVAMVDAYGNITTNQTPVNVSVDISPAGGSVHAASFNPLSQGVFSVTDFKVRGTPGVDYFLTVSVNQGQGLDALSPVTSPAFRMLPGAPKSMAIAQTPVGGVTGEELAVQPGIELLDAAGNRVGETAPVTFQVELLRQDNSVVAAGGVTLPSLEVTDSPYIASSGLFEFSGIKVSGLASEDFRLRITSTNLDDPLTITTPVFRVSNGSADKLIINQDVVATPGAIASATRAAFGTQPELRLEDNVGNLVANDSNTRIIAIINGQNAQLIGQRIATAQNGIVRFQNLGVQGPLNQSYTITYRKASTSEAEFYLGLSTSPAVAPTDSQVGGVWTNGITFRLNPGPAATMQLDLGVANRQVTGIAAQAQPTLRIFDIDGNLASTSADIQVAASLTAGASGSLVGDLTADFESGIARFSNIAVAGLPSESYSITFTSGGMPAVVQDGVFVNRAPVLSLSYLPQTFAVGRTVSAAISTESDGVLTFFVPDASSSSCSVNPSTGVVLILSAGECRVNLTQAESQQVVGGQGRGSWLSANVSATFQIAKAEQSAVFSAVSGSVTVSPGVGQSGPDTFRVTTAFGTPLQLAFGGGNVSASMTLELTNSPQLIAAGRNIQPCVLVGNTVFAGNVQLVSGVPGAACRVLATLPGNVNYNPVSTAVDIIVLPIAQSSLSIVSNQVVEFEGRQRLFVSGGNGPGSVSFQVVSGQTNCRVLDVNNHPHVEGLNAGSCEIRALKDGSNNFFPTQSLTQSIQVVQTSQFIRFTSTIPQAPKPIGSPGALVVNYEYEPRAVASSRLPVDLSIAQETISGSPVAAACELQSGKITFTGPGRCVVVAQQAGNSNYLPAPQITQLIVVDKLNQTITFDQITDRDFGSPAFRLNATSNAGLPVSYTQSPQASTLSCTVTSDGLVSLGQAGECEILAIQEGNNSYLAAPRVKQMFNVIAKPAAKPFITSLAASNESLLLSFREPSYRGGSRITAYEAIVTDISTSEVIVSYACLPLDDTPQFDSSGSPIVMPQGTVNCEIGGLTNGHPYTVQIAAVTAYGAGELSDTSQPATPKPNFSAPQQLTAQSDSTSATLNWSQPLAIEGSFQSYEIFVRPIGVNEFTPLGAVNQFSMTASSIALDSLPRAPIVEPEPEVSDSSTVSTESSSVDQNPFSIFTQLFSFQFAPFSFMSFNDTPFLPMARTLNNTPAPATSTELASNYEFKVVTITDVNSTSVAINTAFVQQRLLLVPTAPLTVSAEVVGRDLMIAWAGSVFDGGANILDYQISVNGQPLTVSPTPSTVMFRNWDWETEYVVEVRARNEMGLSQPSVIRITTPIDPTPPPLPPSVSEVVLTFPESQAIQAFGQVPLMTSFTPRIVQPGAVVRVLGTKFNTINSIKVGPMQVEFVVHGPNSLSLKIPVNAEPGVYNVEHMSDWGRVTIQNALTVAGSAVNEDIVQPVVPQPTQSPVTPTDPGTGGGTNPVTPTQSPVTPTEPGTGGGTTPVTPTQSPVTPTDPGTGGGTTPVGPTQSPVTPTDPVQPGGGSGGGAINPGNGGGSNETDVDGDGVTTNEDPDIDGDGLANAVDPDIDGDTIPNELDPNPVVPNDPSEALTSSDQATDTNQGLFAQNPLAALIVLLIILGAAALGAAPAAAKLRARRREQNN